METFSLQISEIEGCFGGSWVGVYSQGEKGLLPDPRGMWRWSFFASMVDCLLVLSSSFLWIIMSCAWMLFKTSSRFLDDDLGGMVRVMKAPIC